jgi:F-type H+-transporting ATPase subunit epsilon
MDQKNFHLEIVTPRKVVFSGEVTSFSAPGVVGGFQVLKNHAPLLSSIAIGEVKLTDVSGQEFRYATSGGFVEVHDNKVVMLAESAERSDQIDVQRANDARHRAQKRLAAKEENMDAERARAALLRAMNRIKISQK